MSQVDIVLTHDGIGLTSSGVSNPIVVASLRPLHQSVTSCSDLVRDGRRTVRKTSDKSETPDRRKI